MSAQLGTEEGLLSHPLRESDDLPVVLWVSGGFKADTTHIDTLSATNAVKQAKPVNPQV